MRILFLTQLLPYPLFGGAKIRAYYMLRYLTQHHAVTLVSFVRDDDTKESIAHLEQFCEAVHTAPIARSRWRDGTALIQSLLTGQPAVIARDNITTMSALLQELVQKSPFDAVHADQTSMAQYGLLARDAHEGKRPFTLLDQHNAMYLLVKRQAGYEKGLQRWVWRREARLFERYEAAICHEYDHVLTVTEEDKKALLSLFPSAERPQHQEKFTAVPICGAPEEHPLIDLVDEGPHIIHLGTMFWPPNIEGVLWFAQKVFPLVLRQVPDAHFTIVGKNPPPAVTALAEPGSPVAGHVTVTGFVADPTSFLARSRAFLSPVQAGGGMRVKIIDGWLWGIPIVSTTIGAEGIATQPGDNILLADKPEAYAAAVVRLLTDGALRKKLRGNGRYWAKQQYNWQTTYDQIGSIYELATN